MSLDKKYVEELEDETVTLELDDNVNVDCDVLAIFPAENRSYIALLPSNGPDAGTGRVYLYRYSEDENGEPHISNIETNKEFDAASEVYNSLFDDEDEYDELVDESEV